jgi:hypothetical protein
VWLLLASAVAGIKPPAEDRSTPFKHWALVTSLGMVVICALAPLAPGSLRDVGMFGVAIDIFAMFPLLFVALVFMNEPPLPPRLFEQRMKGSMFGFVGRAIGPGAAPTLRFAAVVLVLTSLAIAVAPALTRHFYFPTASDHEQYDLGLLVLGVGHAAVLFFFLSMGTALRVFLRNGVAARILAIAVLATISLVPFLFTAILDPASLERLDDDIPILIQASPIGPSILAIDIADDEISKAQALFVALPAILYGGAGLLFWLIVELRVFRVAKLDKELRARREQRTRTSEPPLPILQRKSRPSLVPAAPASSDVRDEIDRAEGLRPGGSPGGGPPPVDDPTGEMRRGATAAADAEPGEKSTAPLEHSLRSRSGLASLAGDQGSGSSDAYDDEADTTVAKGEEPEK